MQISPLLSATMMASVRWLILWGRYKAFPIRKENHQSIEGSSYSAGVEVNKSRLFDSDPLHTYPCRGIGK